MVHDLEEIDKRVNGLGSEAGYEARVEFVAANLPPLASTRSDSANTTNHHFKTTCEAGSSSFRFFLAAIIIHQGGFAIVGQTGTSSVIR